MLVLGYIGGYVGMEVRFWWRGLVSLEIGVCWVLL